VVNRTYSQTIKCISHLGPALNLALGLISFRYGTQIALGPVPILFLHSESSVFISVEMRQTVVTAGKTKLKKEWEKKSKKKMKKKWNISFGTRPNLIWGQGQIALGPCPALPQISFGPNAQSHFGLRANLSMTLKFIHMSHKCVVLAYWHPCTYKVGVYLSVEPLQYTRAEYIRSTSFINRTYSYFYIPSHQFF